MSKKDYPELEGMIIDYKYKNDNVRKGIVIGCNYDIGLTIVDKDDKDYYLLCFNGKESPGMKSGRLKITGDPRKYKMLFYSAVAQIKKGVINASKFDSIAAALNDYAQSNLSAENCPWGQ